MVRLDACLQAESRERRGEPGPFADLERWGAAAAKRNDREGLRRLQYVSLVLMNQSEYSKFDHWNTTHNYNLCRSVFECIAAHVAASTRIRQTTKVENVFAFKSVPKEWRKVCQPILF